MHRFTLRLAAAAIAAASALSAASAGPQYVDGTGFAVSGYDVVAYFDLAQAPLGQSQPAPVKGRAGITAEHNGAVFAFSSEANRDRFLADPERYAPQFDGHCAYGVAKGGKVPGNPELWRIDGGKLYLNITSRIARNWERDVPGYLEEAAGEWPALEPDAASADPIPRFESTAPLTD
ncbi:YHS domain-containing (seleno)protein [Mangrovicoccus sp. HB161399]|uniref:YHS domain-containing (seleno)protein n=1 Tax=Mangrovicoccus sp. HB161399 TaxID=2720392 RepID=UPI001556ACBD|nr:YHS domain-containing (seleno)protein [Mangrovicoccus sp. HB161399]